MIDIAMNNRDILVNEFGDIALCNTQGEDIIQMANNSIQTIFGELIHHPDIGNEMYNNRVKMSDAGFQDVEQYCRYAILRGDDRVLEVQDITATKSDIPGQCNVSYILLTRDGTLTGALDCRISINT